MEDVLPAVLPPSTRHDRFDALWERLCGDLPPLEAEPWREIPWKLSLLEARRVAAAERKPLLMLVRSGHPLGCT